MLYLIGGASRAGKSTLAQRVLVDAHVAYLPVDLLLIGLDHGVPSFRLDPTVKLPGDELWPVLGDTVWPVLRAMADAVLQEGSVYGLEGTVLQPKHAAELQQRRGSDVRACFLGYASVDPEEKLRHMRETGALANDWVQQRTDDQLHVLIEEMIRYSHYLKRECQQYGLCYIDGSVSFMEAIDQAARYMISTKALPARSDREAFLPR